MRGSVELSFVFQALRRWGFLVALFMLAGPLFLFLRGEGPTEYVGRSQLLIAPSSATANDANSLERNLNSQLSVLRSGGTASLVAEAVGDDQTALTVRRATTFREVAGADVVEIEAVTRDPALSRDIAQGYADVYIEVSLAESLATTAPERQVVDARLTELTNEIATVNDELADAVAPFIARQGEASPPAIPAPSVIAPVAAARQQLLLTEYEQTLSRRLTLSEQERVLQRSRVLQDAVVERERAGGGLLRDIGVVIASGLLGLVVALVCTRFSKRVLGEQDVEEALGRRIVARWQDERALRRSPLAVLDQRRATTADERRLWVQAERLCPLDGPSIVAVTGAAQSAGTTTVALSLARQFAESGRRTIVVDATANGAVTSALALGDHGGIAAVLAGTSARSATAPTATEGLALLGSVPGGVRRSSVRGLLTDVAAGSSDVVVVDAAPVGTSAAAIEVCLVAHAVVLATPVEALRADELREVGGLLADVRERLLPVLTRPSRGARARRRQPDAAGPALPAGRDVARVAI